MSDLGVTSGWALLVAASLLAGALAAAWVRLSPSFAALVSSFGGGILFAAVAFELVPEADRGAGPAWTAVGLLLGAGLYVAADAWLTRDEQLERVRRSGHAAAAGKPMMMASGGSNPTAEARPARLPPDGALASAPAGTSASTPAGASAGTPAGASSRAPSDGAQVARGEAIAAGIVVDGIPESLALGLMVAGGAPGLALLVAVVVGNLTEAYGAAQPILAGGRSRRFAIGLLGGIGALLGLTTLLGGSAGVMSGTLIGVAQAVAAGAVIAVLSISIIPYTFEEVSSPVALATTLGFAAGYLLS